MIANWAETLASQNSGTQYKLNVMPTLNERLTGSWQAWVLLLRCKKCCHLYNGVHVLVKWPVWESRIFSMQIMIPVMKITKYHALWGVVPLSFMHHWYPWCPWKYFWYYWPLTHWGRETHICIGSLTIIGSDNGLVSAKPLSEPMMEYCLLDP